MMTTAEGEPAVLASFADGVAHIRLNRPKSLNAINVELAQGLLQALRAAVNDPAVRCILLSGIGRSFMAGGDIGFLRQHGENAPAAAMQLIEPAHEAIRLMASCRAPVVAAVHGPVAGGGMSFAMAADLAIAAEDVRFTMAYAAIGASPDCSGSWSLVKLIGLRRAMAIALLNETIDGPRALEFGLVNRLYPPEKLESEALDLARRLAAGPTVALAETKALLRAAASRSLDSQLDAEADAFRTCAGTSDFREALDAFFGKRKPVFTGL